jgi:hypothetical protein
MPIKRIVAWYKRYERPFSSISLIGGFVFDALTLRRVDAFWENFWIVVHLLVVAGAILVLNRMKPLLESEVVGKTDAELDFWMVNLLQFTFGGILSAFLIFFFRGSVLSASWPFLLILTIAFIANERLKHHFERTIFQISLFFLSLFVFAIYIVPVIVGSIGPWVFLLSGVLSLVLLKFFLVLMTRISRTRSVPLKEIWISVVVIFFGMNALYFTNIIPPLPLSLSDGGVYYSVSRSLGGEYLLESEKARWIDYLKPSTDMHIEQGQPLFVFTAVFSPARLDTDIVHEWQNFIEENGEWVTTSRISLHITGGREEGFRTYSVSRVSQGKWRVNIKTPSGQTIGRVNFTAKLGNSLRGRIIEKH